MGHPSHKKQMKNQLLHTLKNYKPSYLVPDILSGLLVAIIALPLSIALGLQSVPADLPANGLRMGIITAIIAGFVISAFGGSKFQIGGPTAAFVVIIFNYLANPEIGLLGLQISTIMAGVILILMGITKCGNLVKFIPYPIVVGFTTGIGITLMAGQFKDFARINVTGSGFIEKIITLFTNINTFHLPTFLMGVLALVIIVLIKKINKKLPSAFIAVIICSVIGMFVTKKYNIATIGSTYGKITASFDVMKFSGLGKVNFGKLIMPSIIIAFLGGLESLLSATVADGMSRTKHAPNTELVGQGLANISSALLGGLPATGAIARTSANITSGAKTALSGIFHSIFILIMYFALMDLVGYIPLAVLSAILINVAYGICNFKLFYKILRFGVRDDCILVVTCLLTVFFDLTYGVIGGLVLTIAINLINIKKNLHIEEIIEEGKDTLILTGSLYFISINKFIATATKSIENNKKLYIDFKDVESIDATAMQKLIKFNQQCKKHGGDLEFINYNEVINNRLNKYFHTL